MSAKRYAVVVNPRGGTRRGLRVLDRVKPLFAEARAELDVHVTQYPGHAREIVRTAELDGLTGICVVGGDGTVHEVVDGLMQRGQSPCAPLGLIPAGSGNTVHRHLRCTDPVEATRRILAGATCPLDVARATMGDQIVYCVNIIGWGAVADINGTAEWLRKMGPSRYAVAALWHMVKPKRRRARLVLDGEAVDDEFLFIIGCNTKFTGREMQLAPHADIGDGKIDVVVLRRASRFQMLRLFSKVFSGSHLSLGYVEYHQVRSFAIESAGHEVLDLDGEIKGTAPVQVQMLPSALQVFV
jgi:sphingosine kinase